MIKRTSIDLSKYRLEKAKKLLKESQILLESNCFDGSINRSYYAIFNAIRSILALIALDSSSHKGVISYFDRYFVKTGLFEKNFSKIAHLSFDSRQISDYEDYFVPKEDDAVQQYRNALDFIQECEIKRDELISSKLKLPSEKIVK